MISICIPVYNFDITPLVLKLEQQLCKVKGELIVIDDASEQRYKNNHQKVLESHTYIELDKNIGRSRIRNLFLQYATFDFLLFLDGDSMLVKANFLQMYINAMQENTVVCGGRIYPKKLPSKKQLLSWRYGVEVESKNYLERSKNPYLSFMTNNCVIPKNCLLEVPFNEGINRYGHEDTFFGYELWQKKYPIKHINNPVLNLDIENNRKFLQKTEQAILSLATLYKENQNTSFISYVTLLNYYQNMGALPTLLVQLAFAVFGKILRKKMEKGWYATRVLNFYKLGLFLQQIKS